jgi:hypothetical protein
MKTTRMTMHHRIDQSFIKKVLARQRLHNHNPHNGHFTILNKNNLLLFAVDLYKDRSIGTSLISCVKSNQRK